MKIFRKDNGDIRIGAIFTIGVLVVAVGVLFFNSLLSRITGLGFPDNPGSFGDQFGVLNTVFSGAAFVGVICALLIQQNQMKMQENEFQEEKVSTRKRNFNDHFYRVYNHICEISKQISVQESVTSPSVLIKGLDAFSKIYYYFNELNSIMNLAFDGNYKRDRKIADSDLIEICKKAYSDLASWGYGFFKILSTIDKAEFLTEEEKNDYIEFVYYNLSTNQKQLLQFIECLNDHNLFSILEKEYIPSCNRLIRIFEHTIYVHLWLIILENPIEDIQNKFDESCQKYW